MRSCFVALTVAFLGMCLLPTTVLADDALNATMLHAEGKALLAKADFEGALARYLAAARAAPKSQAITQDARALKRVVAQRKALDAPKQHPKWEGIAMSLHAYYLREGLPAEAVALGRRGVKVLKNGAAEARLAEGLLEAGRHDQVMTLLAAPATWKRAERHVIFHGIALVRAGQVDKATALAKTLKLPAKADPRLLRDGARLHAVLGNETAAAALLVRAFETTPVANLPAFKKQVRTHADFGPVLAGPAMTKAMTTASKLKPTSCSGGTDCGSCPSRGKCGGGK